jgi:hypothetical protein
VSKLSTGALAGKQPLASVHPGYLDELFASRLGIQTGASRVAINTDETKQFNVAGVYTLEQIAQAESEFPGVRGKAIKGLEQPLRKPAPNEALLIVRGQFTRGAPLAWWSSHWVALSQIGWSWLYVWLLEGNTEAQFHLFASLAFLAFYRDWTVLLTAMVAAIAWPLTKLALLPDSYTIAPAAWSRLMHQAAYVAAETAMTGTPFRSKYVRTFFKRF